MEPLRCAPFWRTPTWQLDLVYCLRLTIACTERLCKRKGLEFPSISERTSRKLCNTRSEVYTFGRWSYLLSSRSLASLHCDWSLLLQFPFSHAAVQQPPALLQAIQLSQFALFRSPALVCGWLWHLQGAKWHNATRAFFECSLLVRKQLQYLKCNLAYQFLDLSLQNMVYQDDAARMVALFTFPQRLKWRQQSLYLGRRPCHITTSERSSEKSFLPAMQYILELKDAIVTTHAKAIGCADVQVQEHNNNDLFSFLGNVFLDILDLEGNSALERVSKPKLA